MEFKKNELILLSFFRRNARAALTKVSRETGVPVSTIFDKLRRYEHSVITRHAALLDFEKLGFLTRAAILLKTSPENRIRLGAYLKTTACVNMIYRVNNGYDFLIDTIFKTVQDLETFLEHLELSHGVTEKKIHHVIEEVARENYLVATESAT